MYIVVKEEHGLVNRIGAAFNPHEIETESENFGRVHSTSLLAPQVVKLDPPT